VWVAGISHAGRGPLRANKKEGIKITIEKDKLVVV
jgi:hypothetical protein